MAVRREADGQTLYWIQEGVKVSVNMMEYQYGTVQATQDAQISAKLQNNTNKDHYMTTLSNAQVSEDASRPYPPFTAPLMIVVSDPFMDEYGNVTAGVEAQIPWIPPLPTLKLKNPTPAPK